MVLRFRVSLPGIKGFARVYKLNADTTLYSFHKQMRSDMEFPQDQLILFKALDEKGGVMARYGLFDLGFGTADKVSVGEAVAKGIASFVYFYDILNKKSVIVTYEGEVEGAKPVAVPMLVETKGPIPAEFENGYVAFEDLPDDQKHVPGEAEWNDAKGEKDEDDDLSSTASSDEEEEDEYDEDDDDAEEEHDDEDGKEIFDGTEDLTL